MTTPAYGQQAGEIVWENEFPAAGGIGNAVPRNFIVTNGGVQATIDYGIVTNSGTQDSSILPDFLTFFDGFAFGGENGVALIGYDSSVIDQDNRLIINLSFDQPVFNLSFDMLHFDQPNAGTQFGETDDGLQIFFDDGSSAEQILLNNPDFFGLSGGAITADNIPGVTGWEGNASLGFTDPTANLNVSFGSQAVQNIRIEVYTGDDAPADPNDIIAGIGDISWVDGGADLETQVSASSFIPPINSLVVTTVNVTNSGPEATTGVTVDAPLPAGLIYASDNSGGQYDPITGLWNVGNIAVGQTVSFDITSTVEPTGPYIFTAEVQSSDIDDPDSTPNNNDPSEDDQDSLTLSPPGARITCNGRLVELLAFSNPTLISAPGTANSVGAQYRYDNVTTNVSANVTATGSFNGGELATFDDDGPAFPFTVFNLQSLINSFQPVINTVDSTPASAGSGVEFEFEFFFTDTGLPAPLDFAASSIDVDGNNAGLIEFVDYQNTFVESFVSAAPPSVLEVITPNPNNPTEIRFQSQDDTVAPGIDPSAVQNIVTVFYTDTSRFTATLGAVGAFNGRLTSMAFDCPNLGTATVPTSAPVVEEDFGDAPTINYGNPIHTLVDGILLGTTNTADSGGFDSPNASADVGDDGATITSFTGGGPASFNVDATGAGGFLQVWVDWNIDGDFNDSGEQVITDLQDANSDGVIPVTFAVPAGLTTGDSFIRLRWSTAADLDPLEPATDGEVEDYQVELELGTPGVEAVKTVAAVDGAYSIPGNDVTYTITVTNTGATNVDTDTIFLVDNFPEDLSYVFEDANGSVAGTDEIIFTETTPTGLTFDPAADVSFSKDTDAPTAFSDCTETVVAGVNEDITFICFNPKGSFLAGTPNPSFSISFRARIQ